MPLFPCLNQSLQAIFRQCEYVFYFWEILSVLLNCGRQIYEIKLFERKKLFIFIKRKF